MAIVRTLPIDDDGSGLTGTVFDRAWWIAKYDQIDAAIAQDHWIDLPASGTVARLDLGTDPSRLHTIFFRGAADLTLQTIASTIARRGDIVQVMHLGTAGFVLLQPGGAVECLQNFITSAPTPIGVGGHATYVYLGPYWHLIDHEQGPYRAYTPVWGSTATAPAIGNGQLTGSYYVGGRTVTAKILQAMGSTSTYGTGGYSWTLPIPADVGNETSIAAVTDSGTGYQAFVTVGGGATVITGQPIGLSAPVSATIPITWAVNDAIAMTHRYQGK